MNTQTKWILAAFVFLGVLPAAGNAGISDWFAKAGITRKTSLNDTPVAEGLKEALRFGIDKTVELTGKTDGYFKNNAIRIELPERLQRFEPLLIKAGLGPRIDELVLGMNRAAEKAAPHAREIFIESITAMTFEDAEAILKGGDTAATQYLRSRAGGRLAEVYRPLVASAMHDYDVVRQYQDFGNRYRKLPVANVFKLPDAEEYVVSKSLDGLFFVLSQQEKKIRQDPAAQVTQLLKDVFSSQSA